MKSLHVLALVLISSGCGGSDSVITDSATMRQGDASVYRCVQSYDECQTFGFVFSQPMTLADVTAIATSANADVIALWRTTPVCVAAAAAPGLSASGKVRSAFAYNRADVVVARQQTMGPPTTDGGYSASLQSQFLDEWHQASDASVMFGGAVFYVDAAQSISSSNITRGVSIASYVTDGAGVVYLQDHEKALMSLFPAKNESC